MPSACCTHRGCRTHQDWPRYEPSSTSGHDPPPGPHDQPPPPQFAEGLAACLEPSFDELHTPLREQLAANPALFHLSGDDTGTAGFTNTWLRALRKESGSEAEQEAPDGPPRVPGSRERSLEYPDSPAQVLLIRREGFER